MYFFSSRRRHTRWPRDWSSDVCSSDLARLTRTDLKTGRVEVLVDKYEGKNLVAPNDVTFDGKGRIYFSDKPAKFTREGGVRSEERRVGKEGGSWWAEDE